MDEVNTIENHDPDLRFLKRPWKGVVFCTLAVIEEIHMSGQAVAVVWPDEGRFQGKLWHFNEKHEGFEPLLIDRITAGAMLSVHNALEKKENKDKFADWVQRCRGHFAKMHELSMERVSFSFVGRK
ncbi:hypothetical protein GOC13_07455 [Sinorhizobium meliloti]|nr:hypothetical protein [Sinorhizobium meliloti]